MRNGTEQIAPHFFLLRFRLDPLLLFQTGGQGTGYDGNDQKHHCGNEIFRRNKVKGKHRKRKSIVIDQHTGKGCQHTPKIALGGQGDQEHRQHKNHGHQTLGRAYLLQQ